MQEQGAKYLEFHISRGIKSLYKNFLVLIEDLRDSNIISHEEYQRLRTRTLGYGNDTIRELTEIVKPFDFEIKK